MRTIDELTAPSYVEGLESLTMAEVRARRDECQQVGEVFSYLRRQIQGRLDIVHADLDRRAGGGRGDLGALVEQLKQGKILVDKGRVSGVGRLTLQLEFVDENGWISREMNAIVPASELAGLPDLPDDRVAEIATGLAALERKVSDRRAALHRRTDELQSELVRRYTSGEADVASLLP